MAWPPTELPPEMRLEKKQQQAEIKNAMANKSGKSFCKQRANQNRNAKQFTGSFTDGDEGKRSRKLDLLQRVAGQLGNCIWVETEDS
ncbi:uncharacterized protein LOC143445551 [Clavelina lepadiformis]|uniref:uncharacterized protein LOC143445551 n=1 Tax=Clavelina lepadiformis TaxID=159417 RepID=UPI00404380F0